MIFLAYERIDLCINKGFENHKIYNPKKIKLNKKMIRSDVVKFCLEKAYVCVCHGLLAATAQFEMFQISAEI